MKRERVSSQYVITVNLGLIMDSDRHCENENLWEEVLSTKIDKLPGVSGTEYNGHFGNFVWVTLETENDIKETWEEIKLLINAAQSRGLDVRGASLR